MEHGNRITFDPGKDAANMAKHGVSLATAAEVLANATQTLPDRRRDYGEHRFITFGYVRGRLHVAVWTPRADDIRAISVRKANVKEQARYG